MSIIFTAGYSGHTPAQLLAIAESLDARVLDIRFKPKSRTMGWSKDELSELLGARYMTVPELGNPGAFDSGPMRLADEQKGLDFVHQMAKLGRVILLCQCPDFDSCHRKLVSEKLAARGLTTQELEWPNETLGDGLIPCLSLWQPWASLIAIGAKHIETRHWKTDYRGPIAIHAAKRWTQEEIDFALGSSFAYDALTKAGYKWGVSPRQGTDLPLGAVVAVATLSSCRPTEELLPETTKQERAFGNFMPRRFGWMLENVRMLKEPVPTRGAQGLFKVPFPDELKAVQP